MLKQSVQSQIISRWQFILSISWKVSQVDHKHSEILQKKMVMSL